MRFIRRLFHPEILIGIGLFLLPLAFFWQVTLGSRTLLPADNLYQFQPWAAYRDQEGVPAVPHNALLSDLVLENLPWKQFIRDSLSRGEFPLWNPYIFAGMPFLADGQSSALYPFSVIDYVLPLDKAYGWFTVSQLWLAGLFMYLLARGLGMGRFGAIIAAIAYQMSSFFIASVVFQMIIAAAVWLPFEILMVEFTIRRRPAFGQPTVIPWVALGAVGLGCEILAGHVEITYYTLLVMGFWAACRLVVLAWQSWRSHAMRASWRRDLLQPAIALLALVTLGLGIGAIQFIPTLELATHNFREGSASLAEVRSYAFPPRHALAFLMPNLFGSPAQHDYYDVFSGQQTLFSWQRADGSSVTDTYWEVGKNYVEGACYVGLLTLLLAAIALLNARFEKTPYARIETAGPYRAILAALAAISLLFVFGTPAYAILYYGLPGINQLHSPFRWVFPLTLCLAVLAGFGAEALVRALRNTANDGDTPSPSYGEGAGGEVPPTFTFRLAKWLGYGTLAVGLVVLVALLLSRLFFEHVRGTLDALFHKLAGADSAFPNVETFYSVEFRAILLFGLFLVACGCVIRLSRCPIYWPRRLGLGRQPVWMALALVILTLDLVAASAGFNPAADPKWLAFEPPAITWLKQHDPTQWRFAAIEGQTKVMNANIGWLYGLQDIAGYDSVISKQYVDYMQQVQPQGMLIYNRVAQISTLNPEKLSSLSALGVKYILTDNVIDTSQYVLLLKQDDGSISKFPRLQLVSQDDSFYIYENVLYTTQGFTPLVYTFPKLDGDDCTTLPADGHPGVYQWGSIVSQSNNEVVVRGFNPTWDNGCLVFAESYFPGWRAYIRTGQGSDAQETEVPIKLMYGNFMGVYFPGTSETVRFRYSPPSFQVGAFTTFMAGVIILFLLLLWLWRLFYFEGEGAAAGIRRFAKNSIAPIILNLFNRSID
ncbi:MAG TPA: hypothetical protein VKQ72_04645, partial [Aggregatilineales bacterium]|nr:hypothetical protein [Aggregatilineales bacterium]